MQKDVLNEWLPIGNIAPHFIESMEHNYRTDNSQYSLWISCGTDALYVAIDRYGSNGKGQIFTNIKNQKNRGIHIDVVNK